MPDSKIGIGKSCRRVLYDVVKYLMPQSRSVAGRLVRSPAVNGARQTITTTDIFPKYCQNNEFSELTH